MIAPPLPRPIVDPSTSYGRIGDEHGNPIGASGRSRPLRCWRWRAGTNPAPNDGLTRAGQNKLVLTIVTGEDNPEEAAWFAKAVAEESAGAIEVKIDNASLLTGRPTRSRTSSSMSPQGRRSSGSVRARAFDSLGVTSFVGLHAPFLVDSYELEEQILASDWGKELLGGTRSAGVVGLGYIQGPMRQPLGLTRDLVDALRLQGRPDRHSAILI